MLRCGVVDYHCVAAARKTRKKIADGLVREAKFELRRYIQKLTSSRFFVDGESPLIFILCLRNDMGVKYMETGEQVRSKKGER